VNINDILKSLIYDRTQSDVDYARTLMQNGVQTDENLRGAYNISDRNRVGNAINRISQFLRDLGMSEVQVRVKSDWTVYDIIRSGGSEPVLSALRLLKSLLPGSTGEVPDSLDGLTYEKANAVERVLYDICGILFMLTELRAGDGYASGFDARDEQTFDDYWGN